MQLLQTKLLFHLTKFLQCKLLTLDTVKVYFKSLQDPTEATSDDLITLTATAKSEVVALRLAEYMVGTNVGGPSVLTVKASTAPFTEVGTVAYTVGA
jgi:hypothetical protein